MLVNLLNNAFDAVRNSEERWVKIEVTDTETLVELAVTDSGHGLTPEVQEHAMEPFFTTKPLGEGTGLGLSIAKGLAESHGGSLVYDAASRNTRFVLTIPRIS